MRLPLDDSLSAIRFRRLSASVGVAVALLGVLVLLGWAIESVALISLLPGLPSMKANAALCFVLAGAALALLQLESPHARRGTRALGTLALAVGTATLYQHVTGADLRIDQLLVADLDTPAALHPGRMAPTTALNFALLGLAVLLWAGEPRWLPQALTLLVAAFSLLALATYLYGVDLLSGLQSATQMALHTVIGFLALCLGLLLTEPQYGFMALIRSPGPAGSMSRRLLPAALVMPSLLTWLGVYEARVVSHDPEFGLILFGALSMLCWLGLIAWSGGLLLRSDQAREQAQNELRASEQRFRALVEAAPDAIFINRDNRIVYCNPAGMRLFGASEPEQLLGKPVFETVHPDSHAVIAERVAHLLAHGGQLPLREVNYLRLDATVVPVEIASFRQPDAGAPAITVLARDITRRKQAEARLLQVIEHSPSAMVMANERGEIVLVNGQTERLFGYRRAELIGQPIELLVPERLRAHHPGFRQSFLRDPRARPMGAGRDLFARRKDGSEFPVEIGLNPIETEEGVMVLSAIVDITARKQAENAIRMSLREKETLLQEIHHRIKNNLQVIASLLDLQAAASRDPAVVATFRDSERRVRAMAMIHETLYQTGESRVPFAAYLEHLVQTSMDTYRVSPAEVRVTIRAEPVSLDLQIAVPCGLLVHELLSNCLKHAFPDGRGGQITVELQHEDHHRVRLAVADDGVGLPREFDPGNAATLGLQLVHALARQLKAEVRWQAQSGTHFELRFAQR